MKLGKSKSFAIFYYHNIGIRNINTDFYNSC